MKITMTEKRFFEWHEDEISVTLRNRGGSYGGGSEVLVISYTPKKSEPSAERIENGCNSNKWYRES